MTPGSTILGTVLSGATGQVGGSRHRARGSRNGGLRDSIDGASDEAGSCRRVEGTDSGLGFSPLSDLAWV